MFVSRHNFLGKEKRQRFKCIYICKHVQQHQTKYGAYEASNILLSLFAKLRQHYIKPVHFRQTLNVKQYYHTHFVRL